MENLIYTLNSVIWSDPLVYLCLGAGLYFSIATRFPQIRHLPDMKKHLFGGSESKEGLTSFQAFSLAVSGRVGTGNIAGVATAIAMGGPGSIFWMWVIAFLGAGSAFAESALAQIYKTEKDGQYRGGPAFYIEKGMGVKWYAVLFAVSTILATGFFLPGIQSNSIGLSMENAFGIDRSISGIAIVIALALIVFGGVKRIGHVAQVIVPFMATGYVLVALVVIAANISKVPEVLNLIFKSAFAMDSAFGGIVGIAISWGVKRGIYSNEAGQGTGPMAAATAEVSHPAKQGLVQAFSVYFDTWFVCTATALMILVTGAYNVVDPSGGFIVENTPGIVAGPAFTQTAVDTLIPGFGSAFVAIALLFFAFTTIMAYYYYTESNIAYLANSPTIRNRSILVMRMVFVGIVFFGSVRSASLAWVMGDVGVGLMAWINLIAILILSPIAIRCLKDYETQRKTGEFEPNFDPERANIKNASEVWTRRLQD